MSSAPSFCASSADPRKRFTTFFEGITIWMVISPSFTVRIPFPSLVSLTWNILPSVVKSAKYTPSASTCVAAVSKVSASFDVSSAPVSAALVAASFAGSAAVCLLPQEAMVSVVSISAVISVTLFILVFLLLFMYHSAWKKHPAIMEVGDFSNKKTPPRGEVHSTNRPVQVPPISMFRTANASWPGIRMLRLPRTAAGRSPG